MTDFPSEKIIHKFLFFLDFVRKFVPVFYLKSFLRSPEDFFLKTLSLVYLASFPGIIHASEESCIIH